MDNFAHNPNDGTDLIEYVRRNQTTGRNDTQKFPRAEDKARRAEGWRPLNETDVTAQSTDDR